MAKYKRPIYTEEVKEAWAKAAKKSAEFAERHTHETIKTYEINGYFVKCIQRKYDACMKKENEYGIQVFAGKPVDAEDFVNLCCFNSWFSNPNEANEKFKQLKEMCY